MTENRHSNDDNGANQTAVTDDLFGSPGDGLHWTWQRCGRFKYQKVLLHSPFIDLRVNNAGIGTFGEFSIASGHRDMRSDPAAFDITTPPRMRHDKTLDLGGAYATGRSDLDPAKLPGVEESIDRRTRDAQIRSRFRNGKQPAWRGRSCVRRVVARHGGLGRGCGSCDHLVCSGVPPL
jgi:hypothetical protein